MTTAEPQTTTATLSAWSAARRAALRVENSGGNLTSARAGTPSGRDARAPKAALRRASMRSLVLAQSWAPYSVAQRMPANVRQSALQAAQAFTLLSSELAPQRDPATPPLA